jgi:DNA-binding transcriptional LysR family regulator
VNTRRRTGKKAEVLQLRSAKLQNGRRARAWRRRVYEWGDLRYFLAAARGGSTLAAAKELGVNQTTVARRIAALEAALGVRLFDRHQDGYRPSEAGTSILHQAERVALEAETLARLVAQQSRQLSGVIRVTAMEAFAHAMLTPWLSEFMDLYPDIRVEVIATDARLDLARGEADVAIRAGHIPTESGIVARKMAPGPWALYVSKSYAERRGVPATPTELKLHLVIGADGHLSTLDPHIWLAEAAKGATVRSVCSSNANMVCAIKAGHGVGPLPCGVADAEPDLVECFALDQFNYNFYLITQEALKDVPRIKALNEFILARALAMRHLLEGRPRKRAAATEAAN